MRAGQIIVHACIGGLMLSLASGCTDRTSEATGSPVSPTGDRPPTSITVGVAANADSHLTVGSSQQLWAIARYRSGPAVDITNLANWLSSNTATASVDSGGVIKAVSQGSVVITATYLNISGQLTADVREMTCADVKLSPPSLTFTALGRFYECGTADTTCPQTLKLTMPPTGCPWNAESDASWLNFAGGEFASKQRLESANGSPTFPYYVLSNNYPTPRIGHITVSIAGGPTLIHTVTQEQPACSVVVTPEIATFSSRGGDGSFVISTVPEDCSWLVISNAGIAMLKSPNSGQGSARITYAVRANTFGGEVDRFWIWGPSPLDPPAIHRILASP